MKQDRIIWNNTADFLASAAPERPVHVFAPAVLGATLAEFARLFPGQVTFAVKSNPLPAVLAQMVAEGIGGFDVASVPEIRLIRRLSASIPLHYNNPVRSPAEIDAAIAAGVMSYSVDDPAELAKLVAMVPLQADGRATEIAVRFKLAVPGAAYDFGAKFGATPEQAVDLLSAVAQAGFSPALTFHPGTQCTAPQAWAEYVRVAGDIARQAGVTLARLNVGGGFPCRSDGGALDIAPYFAAITDALAAFDTPPALVCEPGRGLIAPAFRLATRIKAIRPDGSVFLNDGIYGGLSELNVIALERGLSILAPDGTPRSGAPVPRRVFGPTCDSADVLTRPLPLPEDVRPGDHVVFSAMGAYVAGVTTRFNGYGKLDQAIVRQFD